MSRKSFKSLGSPPECRPQPSAGRRYLIPIYRGPVSSRLTRRSGCCENFAQHFGRGPVGEGRLWSGRSWASLADHIERPTRASHRQRPREVRISAHKCCWLCFKSKAWGPCEPKAYASGRPCGASPGTKRPWNSVNWKTPWKSRAKFQDFFGSISCRYKMI